MVGDWVSSLGFGVLISAEIAFVPAMIVAVPTCRKNSLDMELSRKKDIREEDESSWCS